MFELVLNSQVKVRRLHPDAVIPSYAHHGDSGVDLYSVEDVLIEPSSWTAVPTGLAIALPAGLEMQIRPKSGLALKFGLTVINSPGTVDAGYRGEIKVLLWNAGTDWYMVRKGEKIAQGVIAPVAIATFVEVDELDETSRGAGGFGSTG